MASFDVVNYSLRPSKSIQRQIVFNGIRLLMERMKLECPVYIGFGSVWFSDFLVAHKMLGINDMRSMEGEGKSDTVWKVEYIVRRSACHTSRSRITKKPRCQLATVCFVEHSVGVCSSVVP